MPEIESQFENELDLFRQEVQTCIVLFNSFLTITMSMKRDKGIFKAINKTPIFWISNLYGLHCACFISMGRIFDVNSEHNIDRLIRMAQQNLSIFSKESLANRKRRLSSNADDWIGEYLNHVYEPTVEDFRQLKKSIKKYKKLYLDNYKDIRHKVFAHRGLENIDDDEKLYQKAFIPKIQETFVFLYKLYSSLWDLFFNGRKIDLKIEPFSIESVLNGDLDLSTDHSHSMHIDIVKDTQAMLELLKN